MADLKPISESQFKINISGLEGLFFVEASGGGWRRANSKVPDGQKALNKTVLGNLEFPDVTLKALYDPTYSGFIAWASAQKNKPTPFVVTQQPVDESLSQNAVGTAISYVNCTLVEVKYPNANRAGTNGAMIEIIFTPGDITDGAGQSSTTPSPTANATLGGGLN